MEDKRRQQEDEIDLREYINVVIKRKKLILSVFLISVFIAAVASLLMPKVYEITSTVQLGTVDGILIGKELARETILNQNYLSSLIKELNLKIDVDKFKKKISFEDIVNTNLLKIKIQHTNVDMAIRINNAIVDPLITQGQSIYQEHVVLVNERLKELDAQIKDTEADIYRTQTLISGLPNSANIPQVDASLRIILLQNTIPNYESNLNALRNQRNGLKFSLINARDFKILDLPIKPKYPIKPKKTRIVLVVGIISIFFGLFLAFFMELLQKGKEEKAK